MPAAHDTTRFDLRVNPQDPSTWLAPGQTLIGADGRDWAWAYVVYKEVVGQPAYCVGTNGTAWSRWKRQFAPARANGRPLFGLGNWKQLRPVPHARNYRAITLSADTPGGKRRLRTVHSLIMEAHVGPCPDGKLCRHLNGKPWDNRIANLTYGTGVENQDDRKRHGTYLQGQDVGNAKFTEADVIEIRRLYAAGAKKLHIAKRYNTSHSHIWGIVKRKTWTHI